MIVLSRCVPQGSVFGPTLWNILYAVALGLDMSVVVKHVAYIDDLAFVAWSSGEMELCEKANETLERIGRWINCVAVNKIEAVYLRVDKRCMHRCVWK